MFSRSSTDHKRKFKIDLPPYGSKKPYSEPKPPEITGNPYKPFPKLDVISLHNILTKMRQDPVRHERYNSPLSVRETSLLNKSKSIGTLLENTARRFPSSASRQVVALGNERIKVRRNPPVPRFSKTARVSI
jgi:hypothetical protein